MGKAVHVWRTWENSYLFLKKQVVVWVFRNFMQTHLLTLELFMSKVIHSSLSAAIMNKLTILP